jgi:hypothetical protein
MMIGDEVSWVHVQHKSLHSIILTTRKAKIIHITERNVAVKFRGKIINLRPDAVKKQ